MESISLQQKEIAKDLLEQIRGAIDNFILKNPELPSNSGVFFVIYLYANSSGGGLT